MKRENQFRQAWIEGWIGSRPDGVLHATVPESAPERKRSGPVPEPGIDEADICLTCKAAECALDHNKRCGRLLRELRRRREEKNKEANHDKGIDGSDPR